MGTTKELIKVHKILKTAPVPSKGRQIINLSHTRLASVMEATYRKRRKGILYRMIVIKYEDGSGEKFIVPTDKKYE